MSQGRGKLKFDIADTLYIIHTDLPLPPLPEEGAFLCLFRAFEFLSTDVDCSLREMIYQFSTFLRTSYSPFSDASSPDAIAREAPDTNEEESDRKE